MFVIPSRLRTPGAVTTSLALLALVGCDDPTATTDLRPEGEPEVLSVLVMNDSVDFFFETATFCAVGDDKRPAFVGTPLGGITVCDEDLSLPAEPVSDATVGGAEPTSWYVRIMFDELLNPDVEELLPILDPDTMQETGQFTGSLLGTQPVILTCGGTVVEYDGYYSPSGNNVTWPLGPSLFVKPVDPSAIATSSDCSIELKDTIVDKTGESVPAEQRGSGGEYAWGMAALEFLDSSPTPAKKVCAADATETCDVDADCSTAADTCIFDLAKIPEITAESPVVVTFNAFIDVATLSAGEVTISEQTDCQTTAGAIARTATIVADPDDELSVDISASGAPSTCGMAGDELCAFTEGKSYVISFTADNAVADLAGGAGALPPAEDFTLCIDVPVTP